MEIICIKKKLIKAIAEIFFKMDCFFLLINFENNGTLCA